MSNLTKKNMQTHLDQILKADGRMIDPINMEDLYRLKEKLKDSAPVEEVRQETMLREIRKRREVVAASGAA